MAADSAQAESSAQEVNPHQQIRGALLRYRVTAYVVGVGLLVLVFVGVPLEYLAHEPAVVSIVGPIHGFLYMVYLALTVDLALKAKWSLRGAVLVMLAGTIPSLSFVAERVVTKRVDVGQRL